MDPVIFFEATLPSILTFASNLFFASVSMAPGGIIPCSTYSPNRTFGSSLRLGVIDTTSFSSIHAFLILFFASFT